jgi:HKD family nuclease
MTFGELINTLGLQKSKYGIEQIKINWVKNNFRTWGLFVIYNGKVYNIERYRGTNNIFDGLLHGNNEFIEVEKLDKLEIIVKNYEKLFMDIFENKGFQTNFKDSI